VIYLCGSFRSALYIQFLSDIQLTYLDKDEVLERHLRLTVFAWYIKWLFLECQQPNLLWWGMPTDLEAYHSVFINLGEANVDHATYYKYIFL
jgi:hypothetical protein